MIFYRTLVDGYIKFENDSFVLTFDKAEAAIKN